MAAEEDKKFDAVLGGFLVNGLRARAGNLHCPESDVLAAYQERSLLPEEMNSWEEHIVGCVRCQAVLAELEATVALPLRAPEEVSEREETLLTRSAEPAGEAEKPTPANFPGKSRVTPISRGVRWPWLAPAGALAAGLLVWVAWHENHPLPWKTPAEDKTAMREPPSTSRPPSTRQPAAAARSDQQQTDMLASPSKDQAEAGGALSDKEPRLQQQSPSPGVWKQLEKSDARLGRAPARPSANPERGAREEVAPTLPAAPPAPNQPAEEPLAVARQTVEVQTEVANGQTQAPQGQLSAPKSARPSPSAEIESETKSKAASRALAPHRAAAPPAPDAPPAFNDVSVSQAFMARDSDLNWIATPNKKTLWRAGHAGVIEFSSDGGASWSRQTSPVLVDLMAGSSPSEKVCWIVGRGGTILRTTDAGSRWEILHSPLEEDLGGVRARDALHATIWNPGNTKVFETADGGVTWKPAATP